MSNVFLSIVVPCYNEEEAVPIFYKECQKVISSLNLAKEQQVEYVFVDDGSKDKTLEIIKSLKKNDSNVHFVSFSRNFGKESALYAGLLKSTGEYVSVMDVDLQDPPSLIPQMLQAVLNEGYDCAATRRTTRKNEPVVRSFFSRIFYKIMGRLSNVEVVDGARDFRVMARKYVNAVLSLSERNRFTKGIFPWIGFKTKWFEYENIQRVAGKTKWNFGKLFLYSIDGIISFSTKPLALSAILGILTIFISFGLIIFLILRKMIFGDPVQGWASTVCIIILIGGIQLFTTGILGLYLSKIYIEIKQRPIYIAKEEE